MKPLKEHDSSMSCIWWPAFTLTPLQILGKLNISAQLYQYILLPFQVCFIYKYQHKYQHKKLQFILNFIIWYWERIDGIYKSTNYGCIYLSDFECPSQDSVEILQRRIIKHIDILQFILQFLMPTCNSLYYSFEKPGFYIHLYTIWKGVSVLRYRYSYCHCF